MTLDLGFADIRTYSLPASSGIIVLRLARQSRTQVMSTVRRILPFLLSEPIVGRLWVVDEANVRIYGDDKPR